MIVDGHVHFWTTARQDDILVVHRQPRLRRDYLPGDLDPLLEARGVGKAVLVQSAPSLDHVRWCLDIGRNDDRIARVIGWVDLESPDVETLLLELMGEPKFVGIRAMVNRTPVQDWLEHPRVRNGFAALARADLIAELLVRPEHLPACLDVCRGLPALRAIIDHGGQPDIRSGGFEPWATWMGKIARTTTAVCKLSGLIELAEPDWTLESLRPFVGRLLETFGPRRLLFGSNWPVVHLAGDYHTWWDALHWLLDHFGLSEAERGALLGGTAVETYRLCC